MYEPSEETPSESDQDPCDYLPHDGDADREPGFSVIGFSVGSDVLFYLSYARVLREGG